MQIIKLHTLSYKTVFWKTGHLRTTTEIHLLPVHNRHTHALFRNTRQWIARSAFTDRSAIRINLAPHAVLLMPLRGHTGHEMYPRGFAASKNSRLQKQTWLSRLKCMVSLDSA